MNNPAENDGSIDPADQSHLKALMIGYYVFAGLALLGIAFLFGHYLLMTTIFNNPEMWKNSKGTPPPKEFMSIFIVFYVVMGFLMVTASVFNFIAARCIQTRKARIFTMVVAGINCAQVPFGTVLGIFTFIVLSRKSVVKLYDT